MDQIPSSELKVRRRIVDEEDEALPQGQQSDGSRLGFGEICYILFRHKGKIALFTLLGLIGAGLVYFFTPRLYSSEARLMVKYVAERESLGPVESDSVRSPVFRGQQVVNSEIVILSSMDLAWRVAETIGPEKILAPFGLGSNVVAASRAISAGTQVSAPWGGNAIQVTFQHPDSSLVQPVLTELLRHYISKHYEVHQALANLEEVRNEKQRVADELRTTTARLLTLQKSNQVFALPQAKEAAAAQVIKVQQALSDAQLELAQRQAVLQMLEEKGTKPTPNRTPEEEEASRLRHAEVVAHLQQARKQEQELSLQYTPGSGFLKPLRERIAALERERKQLETADPSLGMVALGVDAERLDPFAEKLRLMLLTNRVEVLTSDLKKVQEEEARLYEVEAPIVQLAREKELLEKKHAYYTTELDKAHIDAALGASRSDNIKEVQAPSSPAPVVVPLLKRMAMAVGAGVGLGVALAFFLELFIHQTVKRPAELKRLLPAPVYLTVPKEISQPRPASNGRHNRNLLNGEASLGTDQRMQPYYEALRDRIVNRFSGLARKPKLVGVCGCLDGNVSTSTAAGLAAALSEAGDLKVLLVEMRTGDRTWNSGVANRRSCSLTEALEADKRAEALIAPNLYLATAAGSGNQPATTSPTKFTRVVPQLNASDYDYIVFDLPAVDEVSVTPGLAKHMDLTLLVVEAERASRKSVRDAGALLLEFTPNLALMLSDTQEALPQWLRQAV